MMDKMTSVISIGFAILLIVNINTINAAVRVARSPQFGGFSQANAQASAQSSGFVGRPPPIPPRPFGAGPGFGPRPGAGFGGGGLGGGFVGGLGGGSISISKSISISRGGTASSSAGSSASGRR